MNYWEKRQLKQQINYLPFKIIFMNKIILFSVSLLLIPVGVSFGAFQSEIGDDVFVFVQSTVRNSDGILVLYLESTRFSYIGIPQLNSFLDFESSGGNDPIITIDDKHYQVIQRVQSQSFDSEELISTTLLSDSIDGKSIFLVQFPHDGFSVMPGDSMETMWTFVRPVS